MAHDQIFIYSQLIIFFYSGMRISFREEKSLRSSLKRKQIEFRYCFSMMMCVVDPFIWLIWDSRFLSSDENRNIENAKRAEWNVIYLHFLRNLQRGKQNKFHIQFHLIPMEREKMHLGRTRKRRSFITWQSAVEFFGHARTNIGGKYKKINCRGKGTDDVKLRSM